MKPVFEIDGRDFASLQEFYAEVSRVLIPGVDRVTNLDAFNDILRGGFGTPDGGFVLCWRNSALSREHLGYPETIRQLALRMDGCHPSNRDSICADLELARQCKGPTVFDWLIEVIRDHGPGGSEPDDGIELVLS